MYNSFCIILYFKTYLGHFRRPRSIGKPTSESRLPMTTLITAIDKNNIIMIYENLIR